MAFNHLRKILVFGGLSVFASACATPFPPAKTLGHASAPAAESEHPACNPLFGSDWPAFGIALQKQLSVPDSGFREFRILLHRPANQASYVLYRLLNQYGLAIACKEGPNIRILAVQPLPKSIYQNNPLLVYHSISPEEIADAPDAVIYGLVNSPLITKITIRYRDGQTDQADVAHTRGFLFIHKAEDPRFVQICAYGKEGLWWTTDSR